MLQSYILKMLRMSMYSNPLVIVRLNHHYCVKYLVKATMYSLQQRWLMTF